MAARDIVRIDEAKCDGCGVCVTACVEGAIALVDGKARLVSESACDGLGACLGHCPQGAITVERAEVAPFDRTAVGRHAGSAGRRVRSVPAPKPHAFSSCPGSRVMGFSAPTAGDGARGAASPSALRQWPVQLHLVPPTAPYFRGADVLLTADCVAYAVGEFHRRWLSGRALAIACPKLDAHQEVYLEKLTSLIDDAAIASLTVMVMEVPCCGGLVRLAQAARAGARRDVALRVVVVGVEGDVRGSEAVEAPPPGRSRADLPMR
ncbi:MAG TPA: 4Fe-4S binding protein [Thermoanaerobaculaceae bacterium]|nr:4Fe-4S binding protein [Thermoanaerobaculaceae bacterium]